MSFYQRHPYLFWQLIGWGLMLGDFIFLVVCALLEFGEWCYPIIVFAFIFAVMAIGASPFIVHFTRKKAVPQNTENYTEKLLRGKIEAIRFARKEGHPGLAAFAGIFSLFFFIAAAYILGERVHLALGIAAIVMALAVPFVIWGSYSAATTKRFFTVKNGEKLVEFVSPPNGLRALVRENLPTLVIEGEPDAVLLNFFYNWLRMYFKTERLILYRIPAAELCREFRPSGMLNYYHFLLCLPEEQFELGNGKDALFRRECDIMGAMPFSFFVSDVGKSPDE